MTDPAAQFQEYRDAMPDERGETWQKVEIIERLEDHLNEGCVAEFFREVISDPREYDMARIEALKILELHKARSREQHQQFAESIASVLEGEDDYLVQQWAGIAAAQYTDAERLQRIVIEKIIRPDTELGLRHNCLAALERLGPSEPVITTLRRLLTDSDLGTAAARKLREWGIQDG